MEEPRAQPDVRWDRWSAWLVAAGALVRVAQYFANRSLWLDEAYLAATILRPFRALFERAAYDQIVPPGFLLLERAATAVFGGSEFALRLVPLLAGVGALFVFRRIARRLLPPEAALVALALFAFNDHLVYFSSEVKPYSLDVAVAVLLVDQALKSADDLRSFRRLAALALLGAVVVWFSHPSVFVLASVALGFAILAPRRGLDRLRLAGVLAVWTASAAALWVVALRGVGREAWLLDYWSEAFLPFPPRSLSDVVWIPRVLSAFLLDPGGIPIRGAGIFAGLVGVWYLARERPRVLALIAAPFVFTLAASALDRYPFNGRLVLFLAPFLLLLLGDGAGRVRKGTAASLRAAGVILVALLVVPPAAICGYRLLHPRTREEMKPALEYLASHRRPGDRLYLYKYAVPAFDYYARRYSLDPRDVVRGEWYWTPASVRAEVDRLRGSGRTWILLSHTISPEGDDDEEVLLPVLDQAGKRLAAFRATGAAVYLYDFRGKDAPPERKEN